MAGAPRPKKVDEQDAKILAAVWLNEIQRLRPLRDLDMHYSCGNDDFNPVFLDFYSKEHLNARAKGLYKLAVKERVDGDPKNQILLSAANGVRWEITFRMPTGRPAKVQDNL